MGPAALKERARYIVLKGAYDPDSVVILDDDTPVASPKSDEDVKPQSSSTGGVKRVGTENNSVYVTEDCYGQRKSVLQKLQGAL